MKKPEVSVVMPVFNRPRRTERAVRSVLEQDDVEFELILVDDHSETPNTALYEEVVKAGHQVIVQPANLGPGPARNRGAELAKGDWLAFLDSDDHWLPQKLSLHLQSLRMSELSIGQTEEIWYRNGERVNPPKAHKISGGDLFRRSLRAVCVSSSTVMLKRNLFWKHNGFDETLFVCEDYDLWLRVAATESFDYCPEPLVVKYGGHPDQLSQALPAMDRFRIKAILGALNQSDFLTEEQQELAVKEVLRKLRILAKGSAKRGKLRVVKLCQEITERASAADYDTALQLASKMLLEWSVRP